MCVVREQRFQRRLVDDPTFVYARAYCDTGALHFERRRRYSFVQPFQIHVVSPDRFARRSSRSHGWWLVDHRSFRFVERDGHTMMWSNKALQRTAYKRQG
jgi:hypothetical protein